MTLVLNVLWFVLGGFASGLAWVVGGILLAITIIGLPWVPAVFRIAAFSFAPFGRHAVDRAWVNGRGEPGGGAVGLLLNIVWLVVAGWYIALAHIVVGAALFVTLIGIPFALQHFKLAGIALAPVGKTIVPA
jgi:uncharacterized membrane protein YccF (DUF307 family)